MATLFCRECGRGTVFATGPLTRCPTCGANSWRSPDHPTVRYELTYNDRKFLQQLAIATEDPARPR